MKKGKNLKSRRREPLLFAFGAGIFLGSVWVYARKELFLETVGFLSEDLLYGMKYMTFTYDTFLFEVIKKRGIPILGIAILATTYLGVAVSYLYAGWLGLSAGMFLMTAILRYGLKGVILFLTAIFPHYLFYLPAWFLLLRGAKELCCCLYFPGNCQRTYINGRKDEIRFGAGVLLKVSGVVIIGILLESYVNPKLLLGFLKIF